MDHLTIEPVWTIWIPTCPVLRCLLIIWNSIDQFHLNFRQVWYLNGPNVSGCWMVKILYGSLKTWQKMAVLCSKMSGIQMVRLSTWSIWKLDKKFSTSQMFRFQAFGIQMVTVLDNRPWFEYQTCLDFRSPLDLLLTNLNPWTKSCFYFRLRKSQPPTAPRTGRRAARSQIPTRKELKMLTSMTSKIHRCQHFLKSL